MNHQVMNQTLKQLRLSGLMQTLPVRLQEAAANRLSHSDFLELIFQDELTVRQERVLKRRTKAADFRHLKTLEEFDWQFNPTINRKQIYELATGAFICKSTDVFFVGPPGVGKTHLAQAIGYEAIKMNFDVLYRSIFDLVHDFLKDEAFSQQERTVRKYLKPELVIIDDMGLKSLPKHSAGPKIAAIASIVETCRRLHINLREYLLDVLPKLGQWPINRVSELTPTAWKTAQARKS